MTRGKTLPKGWEEEVRFSANEVHKAVVQAITRILYDIVEEHEIRESEFISVKWLRDYTDKLAETFPKLGEVDE